ARRRARRSGWSLPRSASPTTRSRASRRSWRSARRASRALPARRRPPSVREPTAPGFKTPPRVMAPPLAAGFQPDPGAFAFSSFSGALAIMVAGFFLYRIGRFVTVLRIGAPDNRFDQIPERVKAVIVDVGAHARMVRRGYSGLLHLAIFYGFVFLSPSLI